jgi:hypothetical protein
VSTDLRRDVRILQGYAIVMTLAVVGLAIAGSRLLHQSRRFGTIDVERINIVEPDGTPRLILSDKTRYPGVIIDRKERPFARGQAGLLFFNDEGTEDGGVSYGVTNKDGRREATGGLMFDQYGQDQTVGIEYTDVNGSRVAGLHVWDRPDSLPIARLVDSLQALRSLPEGPERSRAMQAFHPAAGVTRFFAGKTPDRAAAVTLSDPFGHPRLRLSVDSMGTARIEFLDSAGRVTEWGPKGQK